MSLPHIRWKAPPPDVTLKNSVKAVARARAWRLGHSPFSTTSGRSEDKHLKDTLATPSAQLHLQPHRWATGGESLTCTVSIARPKHRHSLQKWEKKKKNTFNDCPSKGVWWGACIQSKSAGWWWKNGLLGSSPGKRASSSLHTVAEGCG